MAKVKKQDIYIGKSAYSNELVIIFASSQESAEALYKNFLVRKISFSRDQAEQAFLDGESSVTLSEYCRYPVVILREKPSSTRRKRKMKQRIKLRSKRITKNLVPFGSFAGPYLAP